MTNNEVITLRIASELGEKLTRIAEEANLTRADFLRFVLNAASEVDPTTLKKGIENVLRQEMHLGKTE